jgi:hypothetical protein
MTDSISAQLPPRGPRWSRWGGVSVLVVGGLLGTACGGRTSAARPSAVPVVAETAVRRTVPLGLRAIGNVETIDTVTVRPLVGGELVGVHFREGTDVKAGEVLFVINPRPYEAALHQAEANLARDEANARNARLEAQRGDTWSPSRPGSGGGGGPRSRRAAWWARRDGRRTGADGRPSARQNATITLPMTCHPPRSSSP